VPKKKFNDFRHLAFGTVAAKKICESRRYARCTTRPTGQENNMSKDNGTITLEALRALQANGATDSNGEPKTGNFYAETLACTITGPNGEVILEAEMVPRVFGAKEKKGEMSSAVGFQLVGPRSDEDPDKRERVTGTYRGLPCRPNIMLYLPVRASVGQDVDLRTEEEKAEGAFEE
jgi:hypothetical protein